MIIDIVTISGRKYDCENDVNGQREAEITGEIERGAIWFQLLLTLSFELCSCHSQSKSPKLSDIIL